MNNGEKSKSTPKSKVSTFNQQSSRRQPAKKPSYRNVNSLKKPVNGNVSRAQTSNKKAMIKLDSVVCSECDLEQFKSNKPLDWRQVLKDAALDKEVMRSLPPA